MLSRQTHTTFLRPSGSPRPPAIASGRSLGDFNEVLGGSRHGVIGLSKDLDFRTVL